jgi:hypothetical protein
MQIIQRTGASNQSSLPAENAPRVTSDLLRGRLSQFFQTEFPRSGDTVMKFLFVGTIQLVATAEQLSQRISLLLTVDGLRAVKQALCADLSGLHVLNSTHA